MNQFVFEGKQKTTLIGCIILGIICMALTFFGDGGAARFWSNYLQNTVFFLGMSFVALFVLCAFMLAYAGWYVVMKRVWEAMTLFLPVALILMLPIIIGLFTHSHHLYHWAMDGIADPASANYDRIIAGKVGFLNKYWYALGTIVFVGAWSYFAMWLRSLSLKEDNEGTSEYNLHKKMKYVAALFLPIGAFSSSAMIWQWVMSVDAHWYSTLFAWYATASWFVALLALTILLLIYLQSKGYFPNVTAEHYHDLGKYLFAFSIFWTYLWFSQFMLIWYGNNGEETIYYYIRRQEYPVLFFGNLIINFLVPFFVLMRNSTKRKYGTLAFASLVVFIGHWWDYFYMIKPGVHINYEHASHGAHHGDEAGHAVEVAHHAAEHASSFVTGFTLPGLLDIGTFVGFLGLFLYLFFMRLEKASLEPKNDPYLQESLNHHT